MTAATYLFVPGNQPERFAKALGSGADAVILDMEDAVSPGDKAAARVAIGQWCAQETTHRAKLVLRINDHATPWFAEDLSLLRATGILVAMLPKTEAPEHVARVMAELPQGGAVIPIVETARGMLHVDAIAAAGGVQRLAFGTLDYAVDLDLSGDERGLIYAASRMAIVSKAAGLTSPIAGVTPALGDDERLRADVAFARACGFGAKLCIHPRQVAIVRQLLAPTPEELDWARRVLAAAEGNPGAFQIDGKMVDRPVILKARALIGRATK
jgi:citrate lyase subunit beta / citryl-CoA lyase